ncbi:Crp/Fnr family transcriptional regulator [bacterium]|nr:Crp/Fnr family transcriptional regulator [bacterium]
MNSEYAEYVQRSSLFQAVRPDLLQAILARGLKRSMEEGGYFFLQGDEATHAYVLVAGLVKMLQVTPNGQQITLRMMTPGQTFGGIALLNPTDGYPAAALAMEDSVALAWDTATLRDFSRQDPSIALNTMQLMHGYINELQQRQGALVSERVEQRIARSLLKLAAQTGEKTDAGILIAIPLTRQDIAEMSGTTLFTVSRTLTEWERQGLLEIGRERVLIRDPHGLVRIADDLVK